MQFLDIFGLKQLKNWINNKFYTKTEIDNKIPNLENYATKDDVSDAIEDLIGTAPTALDTLGEIAEALSNGEAVESALTNQIAAKYTKPSTGIPATDLSSDVQSALNNANSAIQTETDPIFSASAASTIQSTDIENWNSKTSNTGTITGITMNGASKGTSGVVDLGTVLTEHQDISGKANTSDIKNATLTLRANNTNYATTFSANAATDTTIDLGYMVHTVGTGSDIQSGNIKLKTINNNSILGEGNVDTTEIMHVTHNVTLYADVAAAVTAGKYVICDTTMGIELPLIGSVNGTYVFSTGVVSDGAGLVGTYVNSDGWGQVQIIPLPDLTNVESTTNKVTSLSESSTNTQYPSAKAVYDMITDDEQVIGAALNNLNARIDTNQYEQIDYQGLCYLRNNSQLIPGKQYCITNYYTTTTDPESRAQDHPFNIIVTALTGNKLSEEARACPGGGSYYANNNLAAWKVWYCLDNDTTRFPWADTNGAGVIYRLIDEFGNDAPYDFKNIQFKRYKVTVPSEYSSYLTNISGLYVGCAGATPTPYLTLDTSDYKWYYTFSSEDSGVITDNSLTGGSYDNVFSGLGDNNALNNNVFIGGTDPHAFCANIYSETLVDSSSVCSKNDFSLKTYNNTVYGDMVYTTCGSNVRDNVFVGSVRHNTLASNFRQNVLFAPGDIAFINASEGFEINLMNSPSKIGYICTNGVFSENIIKSTGNIESLVANDLVSNNTFNVSSMLHNELTFWMNNTVNSSASFENNKVGHRFRYNNINAQFANNSFDGAQFQYITFNAPVISCNFNSILEYITIPASGTSRVAFADFSGRISGTSSAPVTLDYSAMYLSALNGVKRRINIEGDANGNIIATWKDGETIQGAKKASDASTWTTFAIQSGVVPEAATATPLMDGTAAVGSSTKYAKEDHIHPSDTSKANVNNPMFQNAMSVTNASQAITSIQPGTIVTGDGTNSYNLLIPSRSDTLATLSDIPEDKVFWATRGTTTYAEVLAAYNAGKLVCVNHSGVVFVLSSYNSTDSEFLFASCDEEFHIAFLYLHSEDDEWESVGTPLAGTVSPTFTGTPKAPTASTGTNTTQIATTAFVQGEISGKEDTSNKVTSLSSSSTDTQYPSAKCVYDMIGNIESVLDQIIQPTNS